ncbi:hypothetical protein [Neobacillus sp. 19]
MYYCKITKSNSLEQRETIVIGLGNGKYLPVCNMHGADKSK